VEVKAAFLTALAQKGETPAEIAAFARALRDRSLRPVLDPAPARGRFWTSLAPAATGWARSIFPPLRP